MKTLEYLILSYFTPTIEITDFNVLIYGKSFFDVPVKNKEEAYENIIEMSGNKDYTAGNLLDLLKYGLLIKIAKNLR